MCYSGKCHCEDSIGNCILNSEDKDFLQAKYGFKYLCPEPMINSDEQIKQDTWLYELCKEVLEQRLVRGIMRKLSNDE